MLYLFDQDDKFVNILTEETGLIDRWFKDYQNHLIDEPFKFTVDSASELLPLIVEENQVAFYDRDNRLRLMRIKEIYESSTIDGYILTVKCEPSFLELYDYFIEDRRFSNKTAQEAIDGALQGSRYIGDVTVDLGNASDNFYWINAIDALFKIISTWGGALVDTIELDDDNEIINRKIIIQQRLGSDSGLIVEPDYNAESIERKTLSYPVTAMWGQGASLETDGGGYTRYITFEDVIWSKANGDPVDKPKGQKWVGDPEALQKYGYLHNGVRQNRFGHFSSQEYEDPEDLLWATWQALQEAKHPEINHEATITVDSPVSLGDTATIIDRNYNKPIELQSQITGLEYDPFYPDDDVKIVVGKYIDMSVNPLEKEVEDLKEEVAKPRPQKPIDNNSYPDVKPGIPVNVNAVGMFRAIMLDWDYDNAVYISHYEVYGSQIKDFVPDTQHLLYRGRVSAFGHDVGSNETWYYHIRAVNTRCTASDYSVQVSGTSTRIDFIDMADEIQKEIDDARDRANDAYTNANNATQNALDAIAKSQTAFDEAQRAIGKSDLAINQSVDAFNKSAESFDKAQDSFDKAQANATEISGLALRMTNAEGDYASISGTVQGLQTQVGNIQGDVTAVTQLATGLQTRVNNAEGDITSLTQTATGLQTQVNDNKGNITSVTQLAQGLQTRVGDAEGNISMLTQTATSLGTRIGEIEDWEIGGRNLALNSKDGWTSNVYKVFEGVLSMEWEVGETYTVTIKGTVNSGQSFGVWRDTGSISFSSRLTPNEDRTIWTFTGKVSGTTQSKKDVFSVYNTPNATANSAKVEWIKIEKGNKATDYAEAPEDTDQKFSAINQEIGSIATRVQTNANNYSSLTQTVQGVQTTVATKADKSTVTQLSNLLNTTITSKADKSEVMQLADVVSTKVSSSQVNSLIANDKDIKDTRDTNEKPSYYFANYKKITVREFKRLSIIGITSDGVYGVLETEVPWSDASGGQIKQTLYTDLATYERRGVNSSDTWQKWKKIADVDYVASQVSILNNAINLRVQKNDVINQINIDTSGVLIQGKQLMLDGDVTVTGGFRVANANIASVDAAKMTTGTLDAARVNIINLNATNINSGTLNTDNITVRGGSNVDYTLIDGSFFESRGRFTRTWRGTTKTHDIKLRFENGYLRARNDNDNRSVYFSDFGMSTFADGSGDGSGSRSSGTIEFFSRRFNATYNGLTLYSSAVVGVDADKFKVDSEQDIEFETQSAFRIRPQINSPGNNTFRFTLSPDTVAANVDGYLLYGSESDNQASGFRFSKRKSDPRIQVVGDQFQTGGNTTIEAGIGEFNEIKRRVNNGNISIAHANLLTVGDDSQGGRLASIATFERTYSAAANMHITNQGTFGKVSSARKYKTDIEPITAEVANRFFDNAVPVYYRPHNTADDNTSHSHYGYIADDVALIEPRLVQFGQDGEPEGFNYDRVGALLHVSTKYKFENVEKRLDEKDLQIQFLQQKIKQLEEKMTA